MGHTLVFAAVLAIVALVFWIVYLVIDDVAAEKAYERSCSVAGGRLVEIRGAQICVTDDWKVVNIR